MNDQLIFRQIIRIISSGGNVDLQIPTHILSEPPRDLDPADVFLFQQGMMPAFSMDGKLLLAEKSSLALSPDGRTLLFSTVSCSECTRDGSIRYVTADRTNSGLLIPNAYNVSWRPRK